MAKETRFERRRRRDSYRMNQTDKYVLGVFRSNKHTYAYVSHKCKTLFSVSNLGPEVPTELKTVNNLKVSEWIGKTVATKLKSMNIDRIVFNKSGYKFHGRLANIVQQIRENGISC